MTRHRTGTRAWRVALLVAALSVGPAADAQTSRPSASGDSAAVVATVQALFDAMRVRDTASIRRLFEPGGRLVATREATATAPATMRVSTLAEFIATIASARDEYRERMWSPEVRVDGHIATLWAPYEFYIGDRFSHCGVDAAHLVRAADGWKIVSLIYTARPAPCDAQK